MQYPKSIRPSSGVVCNLLCVELRRATYIHTYIHTYLHTYLPRHIDRLISKESPSILVPKGVWVSQKRGPAKRLFSFPFEASMETWRPVSFPSMKQTRVPKLKGSELTEATHFAWRHAISKDHQALIRRRVQLALRRASASYIHTYIHTYLHTYLPTYIHTCIHSARSHPLCNKSNGLRTGFPVGKVA